LGRLERAQHPVTVHVQLPLMSADEIIEPGVHPLHRNRHRTTSPDDTLTIVPVIARAWSEARNAAVSARSGRWVAGRRVASCDIIASMADRSSPPWASLAASGNDSGIPAAHSPTTRTPRGPTSAAR